MNHQTFRFVLPFCLLLLVAFPLKNLQAQQDKKKQEKPSLDELMGEVRSFFEDGELEDALEVLRKARKHYPKSISANMVSIQLLHQVGNEQAEDERKKANKYFYESAAIARNVLKFEKVPENAIPYLGTAIYNEARSLAINGKKDKALKSLKEAFEIGFEGVEAAQKDKDFGDLLKSEKFKSILVASEKLVKERRKKALAKKVEEIRKQIKEFESFDFDFQLTSSDGKDISLKDFRGKFLIVDFWGTWCVPCVKEIPHFVKLKKVYGKKGLDVVGIAYENTDPEEAADAVNKFLAKNKVNYKSLIGDDETSDAAGVDGFPTTLFINAKGKVVFKISSYHDYDVLEAIVKELMFAKKEDQKKNEGEKKTKDK